MHEYFFYISDSPVKQSMATVIQQIINQGEMGVDQGVEWEGLEVVGVHQMPHQWQEADEVGKTLKVFLLQW